MKRIFYSLLMLLIAVPAFSQTADPVLFTVNGKEVLRSEFEYAYNKNQGNISEGAQTVEEYLQMYIDFKLKVAEAEALELDKLT